MNFVVQPGCFGGYVYYVWNTTTNQIVEAGGARTYAEANTRALAAYHAHK